MLAVVVVVHIAQVMVALVVLVVGHRVLVGLAQEIVELQILAVVVVEQPLLVQIQEVLAVQVLSFFLFQHHDTQVQPQAHQRLRQAGQTPF